MSFSGKETIKHFVPNAFILVNLIALCDGPAGFLQVNGVIPEDANCAFIFTAAAQIPKPAVDNAAKPKTTSNVFQIGFFMYPLIQRFMPTSTRWTSPVAASSVSSGSMASFWTL
jgi:hypothetical protein